MPRIDRRVSLQQSVSARERLLIQLMLRLVNPVRAHVQMAPLTTADVVPILRQLLQQREEP